MIPSTKVLSLIDPPWRFSTLISDKSTILSPSSIVPTELTALTQMSAKNDFTAPADLPVRDVLATSINTALSFLVEIPCDSRQPTAFSAANLKPSQITVGWTFCSIRSSDLFNSSPERTTADVVPS